MTVVPFPTGLVLENRGAEDADEPAMLAEIYTVSHNFKGQGSSFGYPLITRTGASLCRLLKSRQSAAKARWRWWKPTSRPWKPSSRSA